MITQKVATFILVFTLTFTLGIPNCLSAGSSSAEEELQAKVKQIFEARALAVLTDNDPGPALSFYDTTALLGRWALSHEKARLNYVQVWAHKRGVRFTEANSSVQIPWSRVEGDTAEILVRNTLQLGYVYPGDPTVNRFGLGSRHWMELMRKDGTWFIRQDFYTDGLGDDILAPNPTPADGAAAIKPAENPASTQNGSPRTYDREAAVRYADQYAGLAWGAGNNHQYSSRYRDMNDRGGDCANFVSQCLGDADGGKLPTDGVWFYDLKERSGSQAWVRAETFGDWIMYSGWGRRVAGGTFPELNEPCDKFPRGAVRELQKGDVIGYGKKSYSAHLALVVGTDSQGYPLVNAHNVDRYHCPWDMGYDKATVFHLYRVHDRQS